MTAHTAKVLLAVPVARLGATRTWVQGNIDAPGAAVWFVLRLSGSGSAPASHHAAEFHCTVPQLKLWIGRLLTLVTGVSDPRTQWDGWTRQERWTWLQDFRAALRVQQSIYLRLAWNDLDERPDVPAEFAGAGLVPFS